MKVSILEVAGEGPAMLGLSLSRKRPIDEMPAVARRLARKDKGHNKFLEFIAVYLDVTAPRNWWQQFATYRVGTSGQSESTMYTLMGDGVTQDDFELPIPDPILVELSNLIEEGDLLKVKNALPEGFLQRRIIKTDVKTLRRIWLQRRRHKLPQWQLLFEVVAAECEWFRIAIGADLQNDGWAKPSLQDYGHITDALIGLIGKIKDDPHSGKLSAEIHKMMDDAVHFKKWIEG